MFGSGGVGKTALVVETIKQIVQDLVDDKTVNDYKPEYMFFFSAKKRKLQVSDITKTSDCGIDFVIFLDSR